MYALWQMFSNGPVFPKIYIYIYTLFFKKKIPNSNYFFYIFNDCNLIYIFQNLFF